MTNVASSAALSQSNFVEPGAEQRAVLASVGSGATSKLAEIARKTAQFAQRPSERCWLQRNVSLISQEHHRELCARIGALAAPLLASGLATNLFFMHKPPGLRLRFETSADRLLELTDELNQATKAWSEAGLIGRVTPAVYEPEDYLFGGPAAMNGVHRLFTLDALAWLEHHALPANLRTPAWALSLALLQPVFRGLGIDGWEHVGVWQKVRALTGRTLSPELQTAMDLDPLAEGFRSAWREKQALLGQLTDSDRAIVARHSEATVSHAQSWTAEYFETDAACVGPREAAAFYAVFHWNRGRLPMMTQVLLTEALASRRSIAVRSS
jgi:thiopeptide-type bacteriocin biosynthesis protein